MGESELEAWIEDRVQQVDNQIGQHIQQRDHEKASLHDGVIARIDAFHEQAAHARQREYGLDHSASRDVC